MNILSKSLDQWIIDYPLLEKMVKTQEVFWLNDSLSRFDEVRPTLPLNYEDILDAEARLSRFSRYIESAFPETRANNGLIESPLKRIDSFLEHIQSHTSANLGSNLLLKCDSHLSISGSIKARGGIYEVLKYAEQLAINNKLLSTDDDYSVIDSDKFRDFYSKYTIAVGSTGNLGLSIGIMSAKLGFKVNVHMSSDAKKWKKDLLRSKGVNVVEYDSDYSKAVTMGRKLSDSDPMSYFVDDENSKDLFLGYAVAGLRLKKQLDDIGIVVDRDNPLFVYLPCGVGGGPGGVAFGLKYVFGDNVHCFFVEPTHSPCMLLGLMTGYHDKVCVQDFGIDNKTAADGLAVGRASSFVGSIMDRLLSGIYTVDDRKLFKLLATLADTEDLWLEPSAVAGLPGIVKLLGGDTGSKYIESMGLSAIKNNITHIAWATGGSMVPKDEMIKYYKEGK